jgi:hypothetical protein
MRDQPATPSRVPVLAAVGLVLILAVAAWLRARGVGHLLMWDEAFDLASVRAFAAGGKDFYSGHFWYHPPALKVLMLALNPLEDGFAERSQGLAIGVSLVGIVALYALNLRVYGRAVALLSAALLAVLPGAVFYDAWIKGGGLVQVFGVAALLALASGRYVFCGMLLGLGMLDKETAAFYAFAVGMIWLISPNLRGQWKIAAAIAITAAASGLWWYLGFSSTVEFFLSFVRGTGAGSDAWSLPWHYYWTRAWHDLSPAGAVLAAGGVMALAWRARRKPDDPKEPDPALRLWPAIVALPAFIGLSFISGKIPWVVNCLFAAWATLAALALASLAAVTARMLKPATARPLTAIAAAVLLATIAHTTLSRSHEMEQQELGLDFWPSANRSRNLAERMNRDVADGERALVTTFHYLGEAFHKFPCPVFTYYLKDIPVLLRTYHLDGDTALNLIREHRLDWALLSPMPGDEEKRLVLPIVRQPAVTWTILDGAYLIRTKPIYEAMKVE